MAPPGRGCVTTLIEKIVWLPVARSQKARFTSRKRIKGLSTRPFIPRNGGEPRRSFASAVSTQPGVARVTNWSIASTEKFESTADSPLINWAEERIGAASPFPAFSYSSMTIDIALEG